MSDSELESLKNACAAVLVDGQLAGTAYLVAADRIATCAHVVRVPGVGGKVEALLPEGSIGAAIEKIDEATDCAILKLDRRATARPLVRARSASMGGRWIAYGFPRVAMLPGGATPVGLVAEGTVLDPASTDAKGAPSLQLYSDVVAAGRGAIPHGFSGSPVVVRGQVVGHLKRIILDLSPGAGAPGASMRPPPSHRAEMGIVYASPIREVEKLGGLATTAHGRKPQPPGAPYARSWYIHRENEEKLALAHLDSAGAPVVIGGATGTGKSLFLEYVLDELRQRDVLEQRTTLSSTLRMGLHTNQGTTFEALLKSIAHQLVADVDGVAAWVHEIDQEPFNWAMKLSNLLEDRILSLPGDRFVIVVEHADTILGKPYQNDFFGMLRDWAERGHQEPWNKLRLLIALAATPALLIQESGGLRSPWNLATPIDLPDFRVDQVKAMADQYGVSLTEDEARSQILAAVGGHPRLLCKLFYTAAVWGKPPSELLADADTLEQLFGDHLSEVLQAIESDKSLINAVQRVLKEPGAKIDAALGERLKRAGIVSRRAGRLMIRYPLYEQHFREQWGIPRTS